MITITPGVSIGAGVLFSTESGGGIVTNNLVLNLDATDYSGSGNWLDTSGNNNDASLQGTPGYSSSQGGFFDLIPAEGDFFSIVDSATLDSMTEITVEMWINVDTIDPAGPNMLFSKRATTNDGYIGFFTTTGWTFRFGTGTGTGLTYSTAPSTGVWQQAAVTIGSAGSKFYINGAEVTSSVYAGNSANINTAAALDLFEVNPRPQVGPVRMDGKVSVFRIYSDILSAAEVLQNYNSVVGRYQ